MNPSMILHPLVTRNYGLPPLWLILVIPPQMSNYKSGYYVLFVGFRLICGAPSICASNDYASRK